MAHLLFRKQVLEASKQEWLGSVRLGTPVSNNIWTLAAVSVGACIVVWLFAGHYTRRVHVAGMLVPKAGLISITANTVGIVDHVAVQEGEHIKAGDILISVSGEHVSKSLGNTSARVSLQLQHEEISLQQDIRDTQSLENSQADDFKKQRDMLKGQLAQIDDQSAIQRKQILLVQQLITKWSPLVESGVVPALQVEQEQSSLLNDQSQLSTLAQQHFSTQQQLSAMTDQLAQLPLTVSAKVNDLLRQLAQIEQTLAQNEATRASVLRAPSNGTVSSLLVKPGASVSVGQTLLALVPDGSFLQAQILVPSQAIGFVHPGIEVRLHYQSFPYQKFGLQRGTVRTVSRSALMPSEVSFLLGGQQSPSVDPLYLVRVDLSAQSVSAYGHEELLKPGMALDADMLLDRRRLVEWIFEPLYGMGRRLAKSS